MALVKRVKKIPEWKIEEVNTLANLLKTYKVFAIASLEGLSSTVLQQIRRALRSKAVIRVSKNRLFERALSKAGYDSRVVEELKSHLKGSNAFIFTNLNPFELNLLLEKYKVPAPAKPGDIAPRDIVVPAGNTGLTPGPILTTFNQLKIPTKIQDGTIWISKDTTVARAGEEISPQLASLLQRLGIEPMEAGMKVKVAFEEGLLFRSEDLKIDLEEYKSKIIEGYSNALKLAVETNILLPETVGMILAKAHLQALTLASEVGYITPETAAYIISKSVAIASNLAALIAEKAPELGLKVEAKVEAREEEEKKGEEEEEEEVTEEEIAEGLGALFG